MFPTPDIRWKPYPTVMDGILRPPYVCVLDQYGTEVAFAVTESLKGPRAYVVTIDCQMFSGAEEMIASVAAYGAEGATYDGDIYVKEAENSPAIEAFARADPLGRRLRHFLLVGGDFCFETLGETEPRIQTMKDMDAALAWRFPRHRT